MKDLCLYLLGNPRLEYCGRPVRLKTRKSLALLSYLAVGERPYRREHLATLLWPEARASESRNLFRTCLYRLRSALPPNTIDSDRSSVRLNPPGGLWLDVHELAQCSSLRPGDDASLEVARRAVDVYHGRFMEGFSLTDSEPFDTWQLMLAEQYEAMVRFAFRAVAVSLVGCGRYEEAIEIARRWLMVDELDEEASRTLMEAYAGIGDSAEAVRQYRRVCDAVRRELDSVPDEKTVELYRRITNGQNPSKGSDSASLAPASPPASTGRSAAGEIANTRRLLPRAISRFVGRAREIYELREAITGHRLVTVVGVGGCGKTRLCLEVAETLRDRYPDAMWWVDLASVDADGSPDRAVAETLGLRMPDQGDMCATLVRFLRGRPSLLILDNCEHLSDSCGVLARMLLQACNGLVVLATSRTPLGVVGEKVYRLACLPVPPRRKDTVSAAGRVSGGEVALCSISSAEARRVRGFDAVRLFIHRAGLRGRSICNEEMETVADICRLVEGMPLAIEMAAARADSTSLSILRDELASYQAALESSDPSVVERHRSMRTVLSWSVRMLDGRTNDAFRRMSVFRGWFTERDCRAVLQSAAESSTTLRDLVNASLVIARRDGDAFRYRQLEPVRQHAEALLEGEGAGDVSRAAHAAWFRHVCETSEAALRGGDPRARLHELDYALANIRAAVSLFATRGDWRAVLSMVTSLHVYWRTRPGSRREASRWLERGLEQVVGSSDPMRAKALAVHAYINHERAYNTFGKARAAEAVGIARQSADPALEAYCIMVEGAMYCPAESRRELAYAVDTLSQAISVYLRLGDESGVAESLGLRAMVNSHMIHPGPEENRLWAEADLRAALKIARRTRDLAKCSVFGFRLGCLISRRDPDESRRLYGEAIASARRVGNDGSVGEALFFLSWLNSDAGSFRRARTQARHALRFLLPGWDEYMITNCVWLWGIAEARVGDLARGVRTVLTARNHRVGLGIHTVHFDESLSSLQSEHRERDWSRLLATVGNEAERLTIHDAIAGVLAR